MQRRIGAESTSRANTVVRIAGFLLVLVASCALTTLHWQPGALRQSAGGVVGSLVGNGLAAGVNFLGATLLMIAAWMAGLSLAFGVSWFTIMDRLGAMTWAARPAARAARHPRDVAEDASAPGPGGGGDLAEESAAALTAAHQPPDAHRGKGAGQRERQVRCLIRQGQRAAAAVAARRSAAGANRVFRGGPGRLSRLWR
jgi:DNA segregation ATPase FtsK/SpoIIIE-like protein